MSPSEKRPANRAETEISRRKFVTLVAAGSAALITQPLAGFAATRRKQAVVHKGPPAAKPAAASASEKEFQRQRASTLETLKTIRAHKLPAGSEPAFVFRPMKSTRKERG